MSKSTIGVDISKDHLDVCRLPDGKHRRYRNNRAGHHALVKWLRTAPVERIVYEATGPYHRAFELVLGTAGSLWPRSIRAKHAASPRPSAHWPRPTALMPPCWPAWAS